MKLIFFSLSYVDPFENKQHTLDLEVETSRKESEDQRAEPRKADDDLPVPQDLFFCEHFFRYLIAVKIEDVVQDLSIDQQESKFTNAQVKLDLVLQKLKNESHAFLNTQKGKQFMSLLQEMIIGVQNAQTYTAGIHYAHSFSSMLYLERSSGADKLMGLNKVAKDLAIVHRAFVDRGGVRNVPIYVTYAQLQQRNKAEVEVPKYVTRYSTFEDKLDTSK